MTKPAVPSDIPKPVGQTAKGALRTASLEAVDRIAGIVPGIDSMRAHVCIAGYPRSGSTMLYLMVHQCVQSVRVFRKEMSAINVARSAKRQRAFTVTKRPLDTFWIDEIRAYYANRRPDCRFVLLTRDPRSVLTSLHVKKSDYFVTIDRWKALRDHIEYASQADDAITVDYRELVTECDEVEKRLTNFIGWKISSPFSSFHQSDKTTLETRAMNGVRPLDPSTQQKWKAEKHRERIRQLLREINDLPEFLIAKGYEQDDTWVREYN
ncbi:hypothetical protein CGZ80_19155 [Rhodopirellula sp. MGV]|nr:hypothetical protein CGZ80_19155 [Rhodopirellula sp. MGV]PNY35332.1 hypothetical protein C2E31_17540 [Rhodopirellula baltica]